MKRYKATAVVRLGSGVLDLIPPQSEPRKHNLQFVKGTLWQIMKPVEFKAGEEFGYSEEIPKNLAPSLTPLTVEEEKDLGDPEETSAAPASASDKASKKNRKDGKGKKK